MSGNDSKPVPVPTESVETPEFNFATIRIIDQIGKTVRSTVKWAAIAFFGYEAAHTIQSFAGHETGVTIAISAWLQTKVGLTVGGSLTIGGLGIAYGNWQARLRRRAVTRMGSRPRELESQIDPGRSSSGLMQDGRTPLMDREP